MSFLDKNLAALETVDAPLAGNTRRSPIARGFYQLQGTDESNTYARFDSSPRTIHWLGGTSMPVAAAEAIASSLDAGHVNGLGLSIGAGHAWRAFVARLSAPQALFVYEADAAQLRMVLEICDLAALLAERKIILLSGDPPAAAAMLAEVLARIPGLDAPTVLHPLPTLGHGDAAVRQAALAAGEAIVRHAVQDRQTQLERLSQTLGALAPAPGSTLPLAFTLTARYANERPLHHHLALRHLAPNALEHHTTTSLAHRLSMLIAHLQSGGAATILSDLFRGQLACIPPRFSVETWIPPLAGPAFWERMPSAALLPQDRVVVHSQAHAARLQAAGIAQGQIDMRLLDPRQEPAPADAAAAGSLFTLRHRIALIADLPRTDAAALGLELPTHLAIFHAAREILAEEYLTAHCGEAAEADILRRAFARAGISDAQSTDPRLRDPLLRLLRDCLIPAVPLLTLARQLLDSGHAITLMGDWPDFAPPLATASDAARLERVPFAQVSPDTWRTVALVAYLAPTGIVAPTLFDALLHDIPVIAPRHPTDTWFGSLPNYFPAATLSQPRPGEFFTTIASLLRNAARRSQLASAARVHLMATIPAPESV